jgi:transcriptional regulator with XRE-family HTH domain
MIEFGKILQEKRISKNLSLKEVSERIKIREHILQEIERGNLSVLPAVYIKSFLKTYSDYLGIDPNLIPKQFVSTIEKPESDIIETKIDSNTGPGKIKKMILPINDTVDPAKHTHFDTKSAEERQPFLSNFYIYVIIFVIIGVAIFLALRNDVFNTDEREVVAYNEEPAYDTAVIDQSESSLFDNIVPLASDSLVLTAKAHGDAWVRLNIDGKKTVEILLKTGNQMRWSAKDFILLTQGNSGAVEYYRNDKLMEPFGTKGTVVHNIRITKDKIFNASRAEQDSIKQLYLQKRKPVIKERPILIEPANFDESFFKKEDKEKQK